MGEKWPIQKQLPVFGDIFNTLKIFMIRYIYCQYKSVQLSFNQNMWLWLILNQWFGCHLRWSFPNYASTALFGPL